MALKQGLTLTQGLRLTLSASLRTGLELLRLPNSEVAEALRLEAEENPLLILAEPRQRTSPYEVALDQAAERTSLGDVLARQIRLADLQDKTRAAALYLIGDLDERGFLSTSLEELQEATEAPLEQLQAGLAALQDCDPAGVGARNLSECLEIQLRRGGATDEEAAQVTRHLEIVLSNRIPEAARAMGVDHARAAKLTDLAKRLTPNPAAEFGEDTVLTTPDLIVEGTAVAGFSVELLADHVPEPRVDQLLWTAIKEAGSATSDVSEAQYRRAADIVRAIAFRKSTLERITEAIVGQQSQFFSGDMDHMQPLSRVDIAFELGLHPTTVGRAIRDKALLFNGTAYPLKQFFSAAIDPLHQDGLSAYSVQRRIREIIRAENPERPLSDAAIVDRLRLDGVDIARRTVAKYRGCQNIPSSSARRRAAVRRSTKASSGSTHT